MPNLDDLLFNTRQRPISIEQLEVYQNAIANTAQGWTVQYDSGLTNIGPPPRRTLVQRREWEKEQLERLIRTGRSDLELGLYDNELVVKGETINIRKTMFILGKTQLTAWARRTRHLVPLLTRLAEQEGVKLVLQESILGTSNETPIKYRAFTGDIDDTELFKAKLAEQPIRQDRAENPYQIIDDLVDEEDYDDE